MNKLAKTGGVCMTILSVAASVGATDLSAERVRLQQIFPNLTISEFLASPVEGLFEVVVGDQVIYFDPKGENVVFGEIWDKRGKSLTAEKRKALRSATRAAMSAKVQQLPLDKALKVGDGKNVVVEFTDPDCPYCRQLDDFWSKRTDVTRYIFFSPITKIHPNAAAKARYILANGEAALRDVYRGVLDARLDLDAPDKEERLAEHVEIARSAGIKGTPVMWVNGQYINGADFQAITNALK